MDAVKRRDRALLDIMDEEDEETIFGRSLKKKITRDSQNVKVDIDPDSLFQSSKEINSLFSIIVNDNNSSSSGSSGIITSNIGKVLLSKLNWKDGEGIGPKTKKIIINPSTNEEFVIDKAPSDVFLSNMYPTIAQSKSWGLGFEQSKESGLLSATFSQHLQSNQEGYADDVYENDEKIMRFGEINNDDLDEEYVPLPTKRNNLQRFVVEIEDDDSNELPFQSHSSKNQSKQLKKQIESNTNQLKFVKSKHKFIPALAFIKETPIPSDITNLNAPGYIFEKKTNSSSNVTNDALGKMFQHSIPESWKLESRFVPASSSLSLTAPNLEDNKLSNDPSINQANTSTNDFQPKRTIQRWVPNPLVIRRFNIEMPDPKVQNEAGELLQLNTDEKKRDKNSNLLWNEFISNQDQTNEYHKLVQDDGWIVDEDEDGNSLIDNIKSNNNNDDIALDDHQSKQVADDAAIERASIEFLESIFNNPKYASVLYVQSEIPSALPSNDNESSAQHQSHELEYDKSRSQSESINEKDESKRKRRDRSRSRDRRRRSNSNSRRRRRRRTDNHSSNRRRSRSKDRKRKKSKDRKRSRSQ